MLKNPPKRLILKLGTQCNLGCAHCHQHQKTFKESPNLLDWIHSEKFGRITFSGGEPLLYFPIIRHYMEALGAGTTYRIVTNGTLLTDEMVEFFNRYPTKIGISYDGEATGRDTSLPVAWEKVKKLRGFSGFSCVLSDPNSSVRRICEDVKALVKRENLPFSFSEFVAVGFVHQTRDAPNIAFTSNVAQKYCDGILEQLEKAVFLFSEEPSKYKGVVRRLVSPWLKKRDYITHGTLCCNPYLLNVNLDGTLSLCPYGSVEVGNIETGIDWELVDSYVPERCRHCEHWKICGCSCVGNVTSHECEIRKRLIPEVGKLVEKYGVRDKLNEIL